MENYKGIYYNDTKEQKYYEGGAHFKYKFLYNVLLSLGGVVIDDDHSININKNENYRPLKDINSLLIKIEGKKSKYKTRNLACFNYVNNPNTQIKQISLHNRNLHKKNNLSLKNYNSRNNTRNFFDKKNSFFNSTISINNDRNSLNNKFLKNLLEKQEKEIEEKNIENKNNINKHHVVNLSKYIHNRNRSDAFSNSNNITLNNNIHNLMNFERIKQYFIRKSNRIFVNKSINNNIKATLEVNGQVNNFIDNQEKACEQKNNDQLVYEKSRIAFLKENSKLNNHLNFYSNKIKRTRNIINKNLFNNNNTYENNKNSNEINYNKKSINNIKNENENNCINKTINNNTFNNNIFKTINIKNQEKILKSNGNNIIMKKYIRKKINQACIFNQNKCKLKNKDNLFNKIKNF